MGLACQFASVRSGWASLCANVGRIWGDRVGACRAPHEVLTTAASDGRIPTGHEGQDDKADSLRRQWPRGCNRKCSYRLQPSAGLLKNSLYFNNLKYGPGFAYPHNQNYRC
jgi:hypothetical protein